MQIVIDISDKDYQLMKDGHIPFSILDKMRNGTPLDLDGLKSDMKALNCGFPYGLDYLLDCLDKRLGITIIEADKES